MIETYPNPWNFNNGNEQLVSSDKLHKVVYGELNEIAMGAPIGGKCYLETQDNEKIKINDWCGGPAVWETNSNLFAIPIWKRGFWKTVQKIGIVDVESKKLTIYSKTFDVLDFRSFETTTLYGYDSPKHKTKQLVFDIEKEKIENVVKL